MDQQRIVLERYLPALIAWISQDLARGASKTYLKVANIGLEAWRCMVFLAAGGSVSAQWICEESRMDKSSVSKSLRELHERSLVVMNIDPKDGRARLVTLTKKGRALHDKLLGIALEREHALVSGLKPAELETVLGLLNRLKKNLPAVDAATERYLQREFGETSKARTKRTSGAEGRDHSSPTETAGRRAA